MRDIVVNRQLQHLGIDQDEAHVVGGGVEQHRRDHGVNRDRLAGSGRAGDQQMRHPRQVGDHRLAADILAQRDRKLALRRGKLRRFQDLAQIDLLALAVGHFDTDHRLARHRGLDPNRQRLERHREVVGQVDDLADLDARSRLEFVHRHHRPGLHFHDLTFDAEIGQLLLEQAGAALERLFIDLGVLQRRRIEQRQRRQLVVSARHGPGIGDALGLGPAPESKAVPPPRRSGSLSWTRIVNASGCPESADQGFRPQARRLRNHDPARDRPGLRRNAPAAEVHQRGHQLGGRAAQQ